MQSRRELARAALAIAASGQRRHLARWLRSFEDDHLLRRGLPWITFDACDALAALPLRGARVFEWGAGGSTLFFRARGAHITSIEHDAAWFARVRALAPELDVRLVEPEARSGAHGAAVTSRADARAGAPAGGPSHPPTDAHADPAVPADYASSDPAQRGRSFAAYARAIDHLADGSLDVVLVDGRARPSCVMHAVPKVKPGGHLLVDDSDRPHTLAHAGALLSGWDRRDFLGYGPCLTFRWQTSLFTRPT